MRILSQDGKWDLPYDGIVIDKSGAKILAQSNLISSGDDNHVEIAVYSSPEKAKKAMEMLHMAYFGICNAKMQSEYTEEEVEKFVEAIKNAPIQITNERLGIIECKIFQFPKDEEIEV